MRHPFNKKRFWTAAIILSVVEIFFIVNVQQRKYSFRSHKVSEIYMHYEDVDGIDATFIKGFKINDTVSVDVTMLEAKDSAGWAKLKQDFSVPELDSVWQQFIDNGENLIFSCHLTKDNYPIRISSDTVLFDQLAISYYLHALTIFHATNKKDRIAVQHHNYQESINQQ